MNLLLFIASLFINNSQKSVYDFSLPSINGKQINFADYKGKKILIVNTASECGYTPQYEGLEILYKKYSSSLVIIGVPANNFGQQEPGNNEEIKKFCDINYGVTFPMTSKVSVKGQDIDPFFNWLINEQNPDFTGDIKWNFEKFLFDENGKLVHRFRSKTEPLSETIISAIETK